VDVVHAHLTSSLVHGALAARLARIPCVVTLHSILEDRAHDGRLRRRLAELVTQHVTQRLIAVSESVRDSHAHGLGVDPRKLVLIPNIPFAPLALPLGFDRDAKRAELGLEGVVVVTASRMTAGREHDVLVEALAVVAERLPALNLLILAEGPREPAVRALVARHGLEGRVRFLGNRYDVAAVVSAADIFCQPTKHEGMPMAVLEAMSVGVPVVASAAPGVGDVVVDGETGLLVPPGDPQALAEALTSLAQDPALRDTLGEAGRRATADPSPLAWAEQIGMIYYELLGRPPAGDGRTTPL
jgi:glycosyltransferase involved in cell wall biosynthesis